LETRYAAEADIDAALLGQAVVRRRTRKTWYTVFIPIFAYGL
jgi:hypothetical protein